jgi:hypothetical protein
MHLTSVKKANTEEQASSQTIPFTALWGVLLSVTMLQIMPVALPMFALQQANARLCAVTATVHPAWPWDPFIHPGFPCSSKVAQVKHLLTHWGNYALWGYSQMLEGPQNPIWTWSLLKNGVPLIYAFMSVLLIALQHVKPHRPDATSGGRVAWLGRALCLLHITYTCFLVAVS